MDLTVPGRLSEEISEFRNFLKSRIAPNLSGWNRAGKIPGSFFRQLGAGGWFGFRYRDGRLEKRSALREALIAQELAALSPGLAIAALAHIDLGFMGLFLFGGDDLKARHAAGALSGETIFCLGNTENIAGSDVAGVGMSASPEGAGWRLSGFSR